VSSEERASNVHTRKRQGEEPEDGDNSLNHALVTTRGNNVRRREGGKEKKRKEEYAVTAYPADVSLSRRDDTTTLASEWELGEISSKKFRIPFIRFVDAFRFASLIPIGTDNFSNECTTHNEDGAR